MSVRITLFSDLGSFPDGKCLVRQPTTEAANTAQRPTEYREKYENTCKTSEQRAEITNKNKQRTTRMRMEKWMSGKSDGL